MDWLKDLIKNNPFHALALPTTASIVSFLSLIMPFLQDGTIPDTLIHNVMTGASGLQSIILLIIMLALKHNNQQKS